MRVIDGETLPVDGRVEELCETEYVDACGEGDALREAAATEETTPC